jgi:hypothetical protein
LLVGWGTGWATAGAAAGAAAACAGAGEDATDLPTLTVSTSGSGASTGVKRRMTNP